MPRIPQRDVEAQSPASDIAPEEVDPREQVVVLNTLLTASYSRNAELESFVSHFAKLESESAAEKRALLKELADTRAQLDAREQQHPQRPDATPQTERASAAEPSLGSKQHSHAGTHAAREQQHPQSPDATPQTERASAAGPSLGSKQHSHADTHAAPSADVSGVVPPVSSSSSGATGSQTRPAGNRSEAAAAPTAQPSLYRLDFKMMRRIGQAAESVVQKLGQRVAKQQDAHMSFQSLRDVLIKASKAILIQVVCGQNPARSALPWQHLHFVQQKSLQVLQAERPDLFNLMQEGGYPGERQLLMEVAKLTLAESLGFLTR